MKLTVDVNKVIKPYQVWISVSELVTHKLMSSFVYVINNSSAVLDVCYITFKNNDDHVFGFPFDIKLSICWSHVFAVQCTRKLIDK